MAFITIREQISLHYMTALLLSVARILILIHPSFIFGDEVDENHEKETLTGYVAVNSEGGIDVRVVYIHSFGQSSSSYDVQCTSANVMYFGVIIGLRFHTFYGLHCIVDYVRLCCIGVIGFGAQSRLTRFESIRHVVT